MKISDLLSPADAAIDVRASTKRVAVAGIAARAAAGLGSVAPIRSRPSLLKREELGSTGIGRGVAIPHARLPDLPQPHGLLARLKQPIEFEPSTGSGGLAVRAVAAGVRRRPKRWRRWRWSPERCGRRRISSRLRAAKTASELYAAIA